MLIKYRDLKHNTNLFVHHDTKEGTLEISIFHRDGGQVHPLFDAMKKFSDDIMCDMLGLEDHTRDRLMDEFVNTLDNECVLHLIKDGPR